MRRRRRRRRRNEFPFLLVPPSIFLQFSRGGTSGENAFLLVSCGGGLSLLDFLNPLSSWA